MTADPHGFLGSDRDLPSPTVDRYCEDFVVGDVYHHPGGRTITATDIGRSHFDATYAGLVSVRTTRLNKRCEDVIVFGRTLLFYRRGAGPQAFPPSPPAQAADDAS